MRKENPSNLICFASRVSEQSLRFGKVKSKDSIWTQTSSPKTTFSKLLCAICRTGVVWHYILCNGRNVSTGRGFDVPHILAWHAVGRTSFNLFIFERDDETQSNVKVQSKTCPKQVKRRKNLSRVWLFTIAAMWISWCMSSVKLGHISCFITWNLESESEISFYDVFTGTGGTTCHLYEINQ